MTAKEYLDRYRIAQGKADRLLARYKELREKYDAIGSSLSSDGHGSDINKPTERKVEKAATVYELWQDAELDAIEIRQALFSAINCINDFRLSDVLYQRYINLKTWAEIEAESEYSHTQVHQHHRDGLRLIQDHIDKAK